MIVATEAEYFYLTEELGYSNDELLVMPIDQLDQLIRSMPEGFEPYDR